MHIQIDATCTKLQKHAPLDPINTPNNRYLSQVCMSDQAGYSKEKGRIWVKGCASDNFRLLN